MSTGFGQYGQHRRYELIPGLLSWAVLALTIGLSLFAPVAAIVLIIVYDLFWTLRVLYFVVHVLSAYRKFRVSLQTKWWEKVAALPDHQRLYHAIFLPTYKEDLPILDAALAAIAHAQYPKDRFLIIMGGEEKDAARFQSFTAVLQEKYGATFGALLFSVHPSGLPGEIPGKGSNLHHMAGEFQRWLADKAIPDEDIIVSAFDVDTIAHPEYFACLSYHYLTVPQPLRCSFQPVTLFSNNIWTAAAPVRVAAFGTTFWLLSELVRPERMWTFSSHSMPWKMLVDVGFWEPGLVSEDSRIFLQALLHYDGEYRVTPIFLPLSMDAVAGATYWESLTALYKQQRRWAWGVEHVPYMLAEFPRHPLMSLRLKAKFLFNHLEGMLTWATAAPIIFLLGYLPFWTVGEGGSAFVVNAPYTLELMMRCAAAGVFVTGGLSLLMLPPRPAGSPRYTWAFLLLQWLLLPVTFLLFGALPAIDAQTRLMLGKYLGFNVTKKIAASRST